MRQSGIERNVFRAYGIEGDEATRTEMKSRRRWKGTQGRDESIGFHSTAAGFHSALLH